eukprot:6918075-Ditylum_brightwellii.AAC.2
MRRCTRNNCSCCHQIKVLRTRQLQRGSNGPDAPRGGNKGAGGGDESGLELSEGPTATTVCVTKDGPNADSSVSMDGAAAD